MTDFSSKLQLALAKIGRQNGTAPAASQDELDKRLHHYYVDKIAESFFKKQAENTLASIMSSLSDFHQDEIAHHIAQTKKTQGSTLLVASAEHYQFQLTTKKGSERFKKEKLMIALRKRGWTEGEVAALIAECTDKDEPSCSYRAVPI